MDDDFVALALEELGEAVSEDGVPGVAYVKGGVGVGAGVLHHHPLWALGLQESVLIIFLDGGFDDELSELGVHLEVDVACDGLRGLDEAA